MADRLSGSNLGVKQVEAHAEPAKPFPFLRPVPVSCAIAALAIIHYLWVIFIPHRDLVCFVADDAFYELQIARHFLSTGKWSFDGGYSTTTGFHLLNVYAMSLIPGLLVHPWLAIKFWMAVGLMLSILSVFIITNFAYEKFGAFALIPTFLVLTAPYFTLESTGVMEYPYVILIAALYVSTVFLWRGEHRSMLAGIFFLGVIGSIARSDFGGLPFAIALTCSIAYLMKRYSAYLLKSLCGLAGAAVGVALDFLHNFLFSGHFLSDSAMTKALWGKRVGYSPGRPIILVVTTLTSSSWTLVLILLCFVLVIAVRFFKLAVSRNSDYPRLEQKEIGADDRTLLASCGVFAIILYLLVYGADPSLQPWYAANFVIPMVLVLGSTGYVLARYRIKPAYVIGAVALLFCVNTVNTYQPIWNQQGYMFEMAEYIKDHHLAGRIGGWNVGIVGFFNDGKVINLDGLINDQIYPYVLDGTLEQYIERAQIKYFVDFPIFIEDPANSEILGFDGKRLSARLRLVHQIISVNRDAMLLDYTLFEIRDSSSERYDATTAAASQSHH
ncbi:MAG: hypothetical protein WBQ86_03685 [Candidatus Binatus sp.]